MSEALACPSCRATLESQNFERQTAGALTLDICWDCRAIWFDQYESTQLAPGAVLELFRQIHAHRERQARPLADSMSCVRCAARLVLTQDLQRTNRISYYRCANGHGRFTTFIQFLREKQFVRSLSRPEIEKLRATVKQVRCSSCGAPVDLARDSACPFCRAAISILDPDAVQKALAGLANARDRRAPVDPARVADAFAQPLMRRHAMPAGRTWTLDVSSMESAPALVDLVVAGLGMLFDD